MNRLLKLAVSPPFLRQCNKSLVGCQLWGINESKCQNSLFLRRLMSGVKVEDSDEDVDNSIAEYLKKHDINVTGEDTPSPVLKFEDASLPGNILKFVQEQFDAPTPIQSQALPIAMGGKNMVGIGQTGSGKTLAFLLPALTHISKSERNSQYSGPTALVLTPTRELAQQIVDVAMPYRRTCNLKIVKCIGGESRNKQLSQYDYNPNLMISTPGRLNDFLQSKEMEVSDVDYVVLDEADRMLDMGFEPQIRSILEQTKADKQVLMFSATWPPEVKELAEDFLGEYTFLNIGSIELTANKNIKQEFIFCDKHEKTGQFLSKLESLGDSKVLVFAETKKSVDFLERALYKRRIRALGIHGDKSQLQRSSVIQKFKSGQSNIMIATDIAARGLDISGVEYVVNFDFPNDIENYVHRIGRTGRSHHKGTSITLFTEENAAYAKKLISILKESDQNVPKELYDFQKLNREEKSMRKYGKRQDDFYGRRGGNDFYRDPRQHHNRSSYRYNNYGEHGGRRYSGSQNDFQSRRRSYDDFESERYDSRSRDMYSQRRGSYSNRRDREDDDF